MEIKLNNLLNSKNALNELNAIDFKAVYGFKIKKILAIVNNELETFQNLLEEKRKILNEGDEPPLESNIELFNDEMNEVAEQVVELAIDSVNLSWFAKTSGKITDETEWYDFKPAYFQVLDWLIVDDIS